VVTGVPKSTVADGTQIPCVAGRHQKKKQKKKNKKKNPKQKMTTYQRWEIPNTPKVFSRARPNRAKG
jgi:hypothetical protein